MVRKTRTPRVRTRGAFRPSIITLAMAFDEQTGGDGDEFVIPENLAELSDEQLAELQTQATENFDALYGDGTNLTDDEVQALAQLTDGIEAIAGELSTRETAAAERDQRAADLAARVRGNAADAETGDETPAEGDAAVDEAAAAEAAAADETPAPAAETQESLAASANAPAPRGEVRIPLSSVGRRQPRQRQREENAEPSIRDYMVASGEGLGIAVNEGMDFADAGEAINKKLSTFNASRYESARAQGRHISEQHPILQLNRPIDDSLKVKSNDPEHVREVFDRAGDESRLPQGSLVAAGGWCAPSQTLYDLIDTGESRDGLLDLPEVGAPRGGISFTTGPDFASLFSQIKSREIGFEFTEEDDVAGRYAPGANPGDANIVGDKTCFKVDCPPFEEYRLDVDGLCITAGLLQSRGYPEVIADTVQKVLIAHDHYVNGKQIAQMAAGSTAVTLPATQAGTAAPVLSAIELQVEHYRYSRRLARNVTLEAVFPYWIRGAIRSDLSRRLGVDMLDVPDSRIDAWFRERGVAPQFVYNWQAIDTTAVSAFTAWPTTVSFLLYRAGTWIKGAAEIISLETIYDSVMLGQNDFTALFTEEGWFVAKRGQDSRQVTLSLTADGVTAIGQDIAHNGTLVPAA